MRKLIATTLLLLIHATAIQSAELLTNGGFDGNMDGWNRFRSAGYEPVIDVNNDPASGSLFITTESSNFSSVHQRLDLTNTDALVVNLAYRLFDGQPLAADAVRVHAQFLGPECLANVDNIAANVEHFFTPDSTEWNRTPALAGILLTPDNAVCVTIQIRIGNPEAVSGIHVDDVSLRPLAEVVAEELVFLDDYEG